jgi:DNA-binding transcriptional ArsR family regulator
LADGSSFAAHYLDALEAYYEVFFAEEEARIRPYLTAAIARGRRIAADPSMTLPELLEALSQGLQYSTLPALDELVLAPSFWSTPLIVDHRLDENRLLFIFGARPEDVSLVPGESVPEDLQRALKALADPTRLRIIYYLARSSSTPTQLAERLRLRPPTVVHHLHVLRLARLVQLVLAEDASRRYALRRGAIEATTKALHSFVGTDPPNA